MPKHTKTKPVNAIDLRLGRYVELGGNDYRVTNLILNGNEEVVVVAVPLTLESAPWKKQRNGELRLIVPQDTPFTVLK